MKIAVYRKGRADLSLSKAAAHYPVNQPMNTKQLTVPLLVLLFVGCGEAEHIPSYSKPSISPDKGWAFHFEYVETPPNPGAGAPRTHTFFSVFRSGTFSIAQTVHAVSGELTSTTARSGKLKPAQLELLNQILSTADLASLAPGPIELAGGSGTEDGWGGSVTFVQSDKTTVLHYSSRGGYPVAQKARERIERFSKFLFSVKSLALKELKDQDS